MKIKRRKENMIIRGRDLKELEDNPFGFMRFQIIL